MSNVLEDLEFEIDFDLELEDDENHEKCHVACMCSPHMGLCGAYKIENHGIGIFVMESESPGAWPTYCTACNKLICITCTDNIFKPCIRCGRP